MIYFHHLSPETNRFGQVGKIYSELILGHLHSPSESNLDADPRLMGREVECLVQGWVTPTSARVRDRFPRFVPTPLRCSGIKDKAAMRFYNKLEMKYMIVLSLACLTLARPLGWTKQPTYAICDFYLQHDKAECVKNGGMYDTSVEECIDEEVEKFWACTAEVDRISAQQ